MEMEQTKKYINKKTEKNKTPRVGKHTPVDSSRMRSRTDFAIHATY